jgi:hypothetical protein
VSYGPWKRVRSHADELVLLTIATNGVQAHSVRALLDFVGIPCALEGADDYLPPQGHAPGPKVWVRRRHYEQATELARSMQAGEHEIAPEE